MRVNTKAASTVAREEAECWRTHRDNRGLGCLSQLIVLSATWGSCSTSPAQSRSQGLLDFTNNGFKCIVVLCVCVTQN